MPLPIQIGTKSQWEHCPSTRKVNKTRSLNKISCQKVWKRFHTISFYRYSLPRWSYGVLLWEIATLGKFSFSSQVLHVMLTDLSISCLKTCRNCQKKLINMIFKIQQLPIIFMIQELVLNVFFKAKLHRLTGDE